MKKTALFVIVVLSFAYSNFLFARALVCMPAEANWTGFYLGANAGYGWSQTSKVTTTGSARFINQTFALGASNIANALAQIANNYFSLPTTYGFIGGGLAGYNYQFSNQFILGLDLDLNGLTNSNNTFSLQKTVNLADFDESYVGSLSVKQRINYLATLRGRLGYLFHPTILIYGTAGWAFGNVTLDTTWTAQESLGTAVFPAINIQNKVTNTIMGWALGAGIEWLFKPCWSARLAYTYYYFNNLNASTTLAQINGSIAPSVLWASARANTNLSLSTGTIIASINYHFG